MALSHCANWLGLLLIVLGFILPTSSVVFLPEGVPTQHGNNARTGANIRENILAPSNVRPGSFGKLFTIPLNAPVAGQMLYAADVIKDAIGAEKDLLLVYTNSGEDDSPASLNAFSAADGRSVWTYHLCNSSGWQTATPVIDTNTKVLYAVTEDPYANEHYLRAINLTNGYDVYGSPIRISAFFEGIHGPGFPDWIPFTSSQAEAVAALLILEGTVYISFAEKDGGYGWVMAYTVVGGNLTQVAAFCTTTNTDGGGGVWQSGMGLASDGRYIFCTVGLGGHNISIYGYAMTVLKLDKNLKVVDWFSPPNWNTLNSLDQDIGNAGPIILPNTHVLFVGPTEWGQGYLLDMNNLGGQPSNHSGALQTLTMTNWTDAAMYNPVVWSGAQGLYIYSWIESSPISQYKLHSNGRSFTQTTPIHTASPTTGGSLYLSSLGPLNGILWALGDDGVIHAYPAEDIGQPELWNSMAVGQGLDGSPSRFQFMTVANGRLYVPSCNVQLTVYGLLPS